MNYKKTLEYTALIFVVLVIGFSINGIATGDLIKSSSEEVSNKDTSNNIVVSIDDSSVSTHTCPGAANGGCTGGCDGSGCDGSCGKDPSTCPKASGSGSGSCGGSCGGAGSGSCGR